MVCNEAKKIKNFPKDLLLKIEHIILSHQGKYEWKSPKKPAFAEALLVHLIDFLDSQMNIMEQEIKACVQSLDFISLKIFIDRIMTHYDTQTSPLNRLSETFHGIPNALNENEEFWAIIGERSASHCNYKNELLDCYEDGIDVKEDSYCTEVNCVLKNSCSAWKTVVEPKVELTPEQLQQKTLEEATLNLVNNRRRQ